MAQETDASCSSIMTAKPLTLSRKDTVAHAAEWMLAYHLLGIPVVEEDGRYVGMFLKSTLVSRLLPKVVSLDEHIPDMARLLDVRYLPDTLDDVRARYNAIAGDAVEKHVRTDAPIVRPDTPLSHALFLLHRVRNFLPVVDQSSGKLIGVVSTWNAISRVVKG